MPACAPICPFRPHGPVSSHHCVAALRTERGARRNRKTGKATFGFTAVRTPAGNRQEAIQARGATIRACAIERPFLGLAPARSCAAPTPAWRQTGFLPALRRRGNACHRRSTLSAEDDIPASGVKAKAAPSRVDYHLQRHGPPEARILVRGHRKCIMAAHIAYDKLVIGDKPDAIDACGQVLATDLERDFGDEIGLVL